MLKYFDLAISMIDSDRPVPAMKGVGSYLQILPTLSKRRIPSEDEDISSLHTQKQWDNSVSTV